MLSVSTVYMCVCEDNEIAKLPGVICEGHNMLHLCIHLRRTSFTIQSHMLIRSHLCFE